MLFHGSPAKIDGAIHPAGDYEIPGREGRHSVVYATPSAGWAVVFATASDRSSMAAQFSMMSDDGIRITFYQADASLGLTESGYVYELPEDSFEKLSVSQYVSFDPVEPQWRYRVSSAPFVSHDDAGRLVIEARKAGSFLEALCTTRRLMQNVYEDFGFVDQFADAFSIQEQIPFVGAMASDLFHGYFHALRVSLIAQLIYLVLHTDAKRAPAELALAAALHDVGHCSEPNAPHGDSGAHWVLENMPYMDDVEADADTVAMLVREHCAEPDGPDDPPELTILKDADAADRLRFLVQAQRPRQEYLRLPETSRVIERLEEAADELYAPEYRLQQVFLSFNAQKKGKPMRRLMQRPSRATLVETALRLSLKDEIHELLKCGYEGVMGLWGQLAPHTDTAQTMLAIPLLGDGPAELWIKANPWLLDQRDVSVDALPEVARLLAWKKSERSFPTEMVWGKALGEERGGLSVGGIWKLAYMHATGEAAESLLACFEGGPALCRRAQWLEWQLREPWAASSVLVGAGDCGAGHVGIVHGAPERSTGETRREADNAASGFEEALSGLGLSLPNQAKALVNAIASTAIEYEPTIGFSAQNMKPNGSIGALLQFSSQAGEAEARQTLDVMHELGLADERSSLCQRLSSAKVIHAIDEEGIEFDFVAASIPRGMRIVWDASGKPEQALFLLSIVTRTV